MGSSHGLVTAHSAAVLCLVTFVCPFRSPCSGLGKENEREQKDGESCTCVTCVSSSSLHETRHPVCSCVSTPFKCLVRVRNKKNRK